MLRIGIVAGEASGDRLGAGLIDEMKRMVPEVEVSGIAGPRMLAAGCRPTAAMERLAVMGLAEVLRHYPTLKRLQTSTVERFLAAKPDLFIGIDAPEFNLGIERRLKAAGIPTVHYVSPQVWAWRKGRLRGIARSTDLVLTLFPFEAEFYRKHRVAACYVGHPLADEIPLETDALAARRRLGLPETASVLAILPGSRLSELQNLLQPFLATAMQCVAAVPDLACLIAAADGRAEAFIRRHLASADFNCRVYTARAQEVLGASNAALLASGTAALEAMLIKRPMVVAYRLAWLSYHLLKGIVRGPLYALPNILAGRALVPEFIQHEVVPEKMTRPLIDWLRNPDLAKPLVGEFADIHRRLRCGASRRAANAALELLRAAPAG